ncbi:transposase [Burkholderia anthina]|uniref:transposase n=1 Tax=Burkholderia anthina TaxID=179879 RepID=UPI003C7A87CE
MNENEAILEVVQPTRRRRHSKEFKEKVIRAAMQPNVSIAAVALHYQCKRHFVAAWTELKPVSKVMSVTSSGGDYFGHTEFATIEPQGPTELHTGVPTASCRRGVRAGYFGGQARAGARTESQYGVQVAPATAGGPV